MKKIVICVAAVIVAVMMALSLTACYNSAHPASMSQLVGTYELETYKIGTPKTEEELSKKQSEDESNFNYTDKIQEKNITCYLVVKDDGTGYYVYGDKDTALYAKEVKIFYSYNEEEKDKVKEIKYTAGTPHNGDDYPGCGEEPLGVNAKTKTLNYYLGTYDAGKVFGSRKYTQQVTYKKVSDKTDLSYVSGKVQKNLATAPFVLNGLNGFSTSNNPWFVSKDYIYYGINIRAAEGKADIYYAKISDPTDVVIRDLPFSYTVKAEESGSNARLALTIGEEDDYVTNYYSIPSESYSYNAPYVPNSFSLDKYTTDGEGNEVYDNEASMGFGKEAASFDIAAWIAAEKQEYADYLASQSVA